MRNPRSLLGILLLWLGVALAVPTVYAQTADLDRQTHEIGTALRCPVCENLSVADSPSPLAGEMRALIRRKLAAGESRDTILRYFVTRYGEGILLDPPQQGFSLLVWGGAFVVVVGGAALLVAKVRGALTRPPGTELPAAPASTADPSDPYEGRLDAALARYQGDRSW